MNYMIIKHNILETLKGIMSGYKTTKKFLEEIEKHFAKIQK